MSLFLSLHRYQICPKDHFSLVWMDSSGETGLFFPAAFTLVRWHRMDANRALPPKNSNNKIWICSGETYSVILQRDFFGPPQHRLWKWGTQSMMKKVGTITSSWVGGSFWEPVEAPLVKGCWFPFRTGLKPGIPEWHRSSQRWKGNIPVCELWKCTLKPKVTRLRWYFYIPTMS